MPWSRGPSHWPCQGLDSSRVYTPDSTEPVALICERLRAEHRELDSEVRALEARLGIDELELRRLKKRKLQLKDMLAYWESKLIPDIDA